LIKNKIFRLYETIQLISNKCLFCDPFKHFSLWTYFALSKYPCSTRKSPAYLFCSSLQLKLFGICLEAALKIAPNLESRQLCYYWHTSLCKFNHQLCRFLKFYSHLSTRKNWMPIWKNSTLLNETIDWFI